MSPHGSGRITNMMKTNKDLGKFAPQGIPAEFAKLHYDTANAFHAPSMAALMELVAPAGDVYQAGTLSGNPLATAAALATLELLDADSYRRLDRTTSLLADGLREAAGDMGVPLQVQGVTGLVTPFFSTAPVRDFTDAASCDVEAYGSWCRGLLQRGVYPPPSQFEAWFPSLAHTDEDVERTVAAAREAFREVVA